MRKLIACLIILVFADANVLAEFYDLDFPGSFDELVPPMSFYSLDGICSTNEAYGYGVRMNVEDKCDYESLGCKLINVRHMGVESHSRSTIRVKTIPSGVQTLYLMNDIDLLSCKTNCSVTCLCIDRDLPLETNTIKRTVSLFPNLEILILNLSKNNIDGTVFDVNECLGSKKLSVLILNSFGVPLKNLESIRRCNNLKVEIDQME